MFRSRSWFGGGWNRPKNRLSLEHLKYLYGVLEKNTTVSENNRGLLVESLRSIAEILIWGDQNDSSVFDFFLEKNMLSYFLHIMRQRSGGSSFVCVQLLQTLNILFENIRNETSLYYLLSNNHVNSIIVHKFDFSDEDVMGYYILFLKTLSLKLNTHTIHFFYNEHTNDFPLYTEAIKFFNHPESMVRIAVRTISLNVYRVQNTSMLRFIRDKTAAPYFSNLVWFIGKHILELDTCVRNDTDHQSQHRLSNLVAEHLDHLHYLNDILCLDISDLNAVLTEHLLHKLFVPLYIFSLTPPPPPLSMAVVAKNLAAVLNKPIDIDIQEMNNPRVSSVVALYLLSLVFLVITHGPLVHSLAWVILNSDHNVFKEGAAEILNAYNERREAVTLGFVQPSESLEEALDTVTASVSSVSLEQSDGLSNESSSPDSIRQQQQQQQHGQNEDILNGSSNYDRNSIHDDTCSSIDNGLEKVNITDEEKEQIRLFGTTTTSSSSSSSTTTTTALSYRTMTTGNNGNKNKTGNNIGCESVNARGGNIPRPFLDMILQSLDCTENDYLALLGLCLIYALANNKGVSPEWLQQVLNKSLKSTINYKTILIEKLLNVISLSSQPSCRIRLITLEIALNLLSYFAKPNLNEYNLTDLQQQMLFISKQQSQNVLKNFYKSEDIFLDLFENEYNEMQKIQLNVEFLCMDSTILLPPTGTPLTGINFTRRLPCGDVEKAKRAIRVYFLLRKKCQEFLNEIETLLPLTNPNNCVQLENILDLNNSDLIACTVYTKDSTKYRRFLVIDNLQLILVEPDSKRLGWGIAKFVGFLQDVEVNGDKDDSRCLHITVHRGGVTNNRTPILSAKFLFDDHIRCMAAKQRLTKGRSKARQKKMYQIAQLLEISGQIDSPVFPITGLRTNGNGNGITNTTIRTSRDNRPLFSTVNRVPGFAAALRRDSMPSGSVSRVQIAQNRSIEGIRSESAGGGGGNRTRRRSSNSNHNRSSISSSSSSSMTATNYNNNINNNINNGAIPRENSPSSRRRNYKTESRENSRNRSPRSSSSSNQDHSPRIQQRPRSEEIPLEDFPHSRNSSPISRGSSNTTSRSNTPSRNIINSAVTATIISSSQTASPSPTTTTTATAYSGVNDTTMMITTSGGNGGGGVSGVNTILNISPRESQLIQNNIIIPNETSLYAPSSSSEETSFIAERRDKERRKGKVETV